MNQGIADRQYYRRYEKRQWKFYRYILAQIVQYSLPGPILDVGSGTGLFLECADRWGLTAVGLEGSKEGVTTFRKRYSAAKAIKLSLDKKFPFPGKYFQTVLINQVIQYLEADVLENVIAQSWRVLSPGGAIFIFSPSRTSGFSESSKKVKITKLFSPSELKGYLERRGFEKIKLYCSPKKIGIFNRFFQATNYALITFLGLEGLSDSADCVAFKPA